MISGYSNRIRLLLTCLVVLWSPAALQAHVPGASRDVKPTTTGLNAMAPDFVLSDQDGHRFDSTALRGKVVVINFIFTTCTDVCPLFTANLAQVQKNLKEKHGGDIFFVSITTDPEVDSPKVLKSYAQRYRADFQNWAFLTGTEAQLKSVWKGFGIRVVRKGRGLIQHTSVTTLLDRQGIRRFNHFGEKWQSKDVLRDAAALIDEKPKPKD